MLTYPASQARPRPMSVTAIPAAILSPRAFHGSQGAPDEARCEWLPSTRSMSLLACALNLVISRSQARTAVRVMNSTAAMTRVGLNRVRLRSTYSTTPTPRSSGLRWKYPHSASVYAQPIYTRAASSSEELVTTSPAIPCTDTGREPGSADPLTPPPPPTDQASGRG